MKLFAVIKSIVVIILLACLGVSGVYLVLENAELVVVNTLIGSFEAVELGTVLVVCISCGFLVGLGIGLVIYTASYFKIGRLEKQLQRLRAETSSD